MVNCVILYRINGGPVQAVSFGDDGRPEEFDNMDAAVSFADPNMPKPTLFARLVEAGQVDFQIVELDEI